MPGQEKSHIFVLNVMAMVLYIAMNVMGKESTLVFGVGAGGARNALVVMEKGRKSVQVAGDGVLIMTETGARGVEEPAKNAALLVLGKDMKNALPVQGEVINPAMNVMEREHYFAPSVMVKGK